VPKAHAFIVVISLEMQKNNMPKGIFWTYLGTMPVSNLWFASQVLHFFGSRLERVIHGETKM